MPARPLPAAEPVEELTSRTDAAQGKRTDLAGMRVHFVGVGGCGMSGLARIAQSLDAKCSGSDLQGGAAIDALTASGIDVVLRQTEDSLPDKCDLVVASAAIKDDHPELLAAAHRGVPVLSYSAMLGKLMLGRVGVAVAGTHGKSSTTSMLSHVLIETGLDPSFIVGANCDQIGGGSRVGASDLLVAEACEFARSFHNLHPTHAVILNVEEDHLDYYAHMQEIIESFATFARRLPAAADGGYLLIRHESPHRLAVTAGLDCKIETIGFAPQADYCVEIARDEGGGGPRVFLYLKDEVVTTWRSPMPGEHMAYNAAAAAVLAHRQGADWDDIGRALGRFRGLDRRMQLIGQMPLPDVRQGDEPVTIVDDYGHHPTEVDTTLRALRHHYNPKRLICVFQPHQHSRTRFLLDEFAQSFSQADVVIVPDIYFVRDSENERHAVRSADLVDRLRQREQRAMHLYPFAAIIEQLQLIAKPGDLIVTMGAGDVWQVAEALVERTPEVRASIAPALPERIAV